MFLSVLGVMFLLLLVVLVINIRRARARGQQIRHDPDNMDLMDRDPWSDILIAFAVQSMIVSAGWLLLVCCGFVSWWTWFTPAWFWLATLCALIAASFIFTLYVHEMAAGYWQWDQRCTVAVIIVAMIGGLASYFTAAVGLIVAIADVAILVTEGWWQYRAGKRQLAGE